MSGLAEKKIKNFDHQALDNLKITSIQFF